MEIEKLELESRLWAGAGSLATPGKCWNDATAMGYPEK